MFVAIGIHFEVKKTSNELTTTFHQVQFPLRKWMVKVYQKTKCQGWGLGVGEFSKEQVLFSDEHVIVFTCIYLII